MPTITKIAEQKRRPNRRNIFIDGTFAFGCNVNVVARFRLREGLALDEAALDEIQNGEVKQGCFDAGLRFITQRLHSRSELQRKLAWQEWGPAVIEAVLSDLERLNYVDDERFACVKAESAARHRHHGRQKVRLDLLRAGVSPAVADRAVAAVFNSSDEQQTAANLAARQWPRLRKLDPSVARRRLTGMLVRRGFNFTTIKPVIDQLIRGADPDASDDDQSKGQE